MFDRFTLSSGYNFSRVIKGHWQVSDGHRLDGKHDRISILHSMEEFVRAGITTFDMADIYTGAEELVGEFLCNNPDLAKDVQIHTKYVPDLERLHSVDFKDTETIIDRSLRRLGIECLDLVQFHWWDYEIPRYVEIANHLHTLQKSGKIRNIGVTNFNTATLKEIVDAGIPIATVQTQYSLLDHRPEKTLIPFCQKHGIVLLCYGALAGGLLSNRSLDQPDPGLDNSTHNNRSLIKYRLIIEDLGGWDIFQNLLNLLKPIADRHQCHIGEIASAYILDKASVASIIVGAYSQDHLKKLQKLNKLVLDLQEKKQIESFLTALPPLDGDIYELERYTSRHRGIMKMNQNIIK